MNAAVDVERYPLPDGQPDAVLNKGELAEAFAVSETALDKWMRKPGFPVLEGGSNGVPYKFQLSAVWAWRQARAAADRQRSEDNQRAVQQMRLTLLGMSPEDEDGEPLLSARERAEEYAAEAKYLIAARQRRETVPTEDMIGLLEELFGMVRDGLEAHPDQAARVLGLDGPETERLVALNDSLIRELKERIQHRFLDAAPADRLI